MGPTHRWFDRALLAVGVLLVMATAPAFAGTIIDDWTTITAPPPPKLTPVTVEPHTTALLMLDFMKENCAKRPRCAASVPAVETLLAGARKARVPVIYSIFPHVTKADILPALAPRKNEPVVQAGADKFLHTDLDKILAKKGIKTVIVVGTASNGAVLYTASEAAMRGFKVIIPVDGMSAADPFAEKYAAWHLANAPTVGNHVTLTEISMVHF